MGQPQQIIAPRPRLTVPGLEARPDLAQRLAAELARRPGCNGCARAALTRKYVQLARRG